MNHSFILINIFDYFQACYTGCELILRFLLY